MVSEKILDKYDSPSRRTGLRKGGRKENKDDGGASFGFIHHPPTSFPSFTRLTSPLFSSSLDRRMSSLIVALLGSLVQKRSCNHSRYVHKWLDTRNIFSAPPPHFQNNSLPSKDETWFTLKIFRHIKMSVNQIKPILLHRGPACFLLWNSKCGLSALPDVQLFTTALKTATVNVSFGYIT